jgi:hypothetical protein
MPQKTKPSTKSQPSAPSNAPRKRTRSDAFKATDEQKEMVALASACGIPEDEMVVAIINPNTKKPISPHTLRKHFRFELDRGHMSANLKVVGSLFKNATTPTDTYPGGNPICQIFWTSRRPCWTCRPVGCRRQTVVTWIRSRRRTSSGRAASPSC